MKSLSHALLAILATTAYVHSQGDKSTDSLQIPSARILGDIPDGTPPPPEPPKPKFIVPASEVFETKTHQQGGRTITVRKIAHIALPPSAIAPPPGDPNDPVVQERIAEFREENANHTFLIVGATAYHFQDAPPRSFVCVWQQGEGGSLSFWSSADFSLLSGFSSFVGSSGETTSLLMMWSVSDLDNMNSLQQEFASQPDESEIPVFPAGKATFVITQGNATPQTVASIQSLHDVYNNDYDRLKAAYEGRQLAQLQREAELKAHPPQPKDITLNYWRIEPKTQTSGKGSAQ